MSHYGNIDHETVAAVVDLQRRIGTADYSARGVNGQNALTISLNLQGWNGEVGWRLYLRCYRLLWAVFRRGLFSAWVLDEPASSK